MNNYAIATAVTDLIIPYQLTPFASRLPKYTKAALVEAYDPEDSQTDILRVFRQIIWRHRKGSKKYDIPKLNSVEIAFIARDWYKGLSEYTEATTTTTII